MPFSHRITLLPLLLLMVSGGLLIGGQINTVQTDRRNAVPATLGVFKILIALFLSILRAMA